MPLNLIILTDRHNPGQRLPCQWATQPEMSWNETITEKKRGVGGGKKTPATNSAKACTLVAG
jgi:hypothetical protein